MNARHAHGAGTGASDTDAELHSAAERFGLPEGAVCSDDGVCAFLAEAINDGEKYAQFMRCMREYRRYAGFSKRLVSGLFFGLARFSADPEDRAMRAWLAQSFRSALADLERARRRSLVRRQFAADFLASDSDEERTRDGRADHEGERGPAAGAAEADAGAGAADEDDDSD